MKGANEYAKLIETGQYGKLYITSSSHARGRTFHIQILPEGETAIPNGNCNICLNKDAVEVYGIVSGRPGWSEEYGWLYEGPWQDDFFKLVTKTKTDNEETHKLNVIAINERNKREEDQIEQLLKQY